MRRVFRPVFPVAVGLLLVSCQQEADPVRDVNNKINHTVRYKAETGKHDFWHPATTVGDCEDYVLAKRLLLIAADWPVEDLDVLVLQDNQHTFGHAVLHVKSVDKTLDNSDDAILPLKKFLKDNDLYVICVARDLETKDLHASKRC